MDIYILRDGSEIGPFDEETTQEMLQLGSIREVDYAWRPGLPKWIPLTDVLNPSPLALETPPPPPPAAEEPSPAAVPAETAANLPKAGESATEKQKALLRYLCIAGPAGMTKDQAALRINDAMEDPQNATRLTQWNTDRLKLHPDLFAAEIQAKKESRVNDYLEICQNEGAQYFTKITKAHCQVLVGYLDVKFPDWDKDEKTAAERYFFPAVAEKFPQLVARQWKGKLRYASGAKPVPGERRASSKLPPITAPKSPMAALALGLAGGVVVLGIIFGIYKMVTGRTAKTPPAVEQVPGVPPVPPATPLAGAEPPPGAVTELPPIPPLPATPEAGMIDPANPMAPLPSDPPMAANPLPSNLPEGFPPDPLTNPPGAPPMAGVPGASPEAPVPAPVGSLPPDAPATGGSLFDPAPTAPPATPAAPPTPPATPAASPAPPAAVDPNAPPKAVLKLTKPVDVQLAYGKMKLPVGTSVKFVSRQGTSVNVNYLNTILTVPASSTDIDVAAPAPVVAPPPVAPSPVAPPPPAVPPPADPGTPSF
jgi:hypothetical protein